jgi:2-keto-3-deoxy-L-rhamnonate aldolase RhmA
LAGFPLIGTWIKTPSHIVTDVLARSELGVLCLDAEHAPFDRMELDRCILASHAHGMPVLVRIPTAEPHNILNVLDLGATGIVAPHITSADAAAALVQASHYGPSGRGYAGSTRAAEYTGRKMDAHIALSAETTTVIAQIEDAQALEAIDDIAAVSGLDCLFIGRADLAVSLGRPSAADCQVVAAAKRIVDAAKVHNVAVGTFVSDLGEVPAWVAAGVSLFLLESDQVFLRNGARQLASSFREMAARSDQTAKTNSPS